MAATLDLTTLGAFYRRQLLEDVLPFLSLIHISEPTRPY